MSDSESNSPSIPLLSTIPSLSPATNSVKRVRKPSAKRLAQDDAIVEDGTPNRTENPKKKKKKTQPAPFVLPPIISTPLTSAPASPALLSSLPPTNPDPIVIDSDSDTPAPTPTVKAPLFDTRSNLPNRAVNSNAAEHARFAKSRALAYHFLEIRQAEVDKNGTLIKCQLKCTFCAKKRSSDGEYKWSAKSQGGTGNFTNHFASVHTKEWTTINAIDKLAQGVNADEAEAGPKVTDFMQSAFDLTTFYAKLVDWMVVSDQPFTEIECSEFRELLIYLRPSLAGSLIMADQLREKIVERASVYRARFKTFLADLPGRVPLACDAWTSSNRLAFLAITASWITEDWKLEEVLVDFVELKGAHSGENMGNAVWKMVEELGLVKKLLMVTADNASNNGMLISTIGRLLHNTDPFTWWDDDRATIRCLPHVIHLAVMALLVGVKAVKELNHIDMASATPDPLTVKEAEGIVAETNAEIQEADDTCVVDPTIDLQSSIEKLRKREDQFVKTALGVEDSCARRARLTGIEYLPRSKILTLILDVATRWNSTYFMLERALSYKEAIDELCSTTFLPIYSPYKLNPEEWQVIATVKDWLEFFRDVSTHMSGQKYVTLSQSLHAYTILISHVGSLVKSPQAKASAILMNGITACQEKLFKFFDKSTAESEYYYFATILDPRFKRHLFTNSDNGDLFTEQWEAECRSSMLDMLRTQYSVYTSTASLQNESTSSPTLPRKPSAFASALSQSLGAISLQAPPATSVDEELDRYLRKAVTASNTNPLDWWRVNANRYPSLARMARDFLAIPASSVSVERSLSTGRDVISLRRASLKAATINMLMLYRSGLVLERHRNSEARASVKATKK